MGGPRLVQWSRFSDAFGRLFGLQGGTALNVVDDVFCTLPAETEALHLDYLRGWKAFACVSNKAAVVGEFSAVQFQPAPGTLLVVDAWSCVAGVANQQVGVGIVPAVTAAVGAFLAAGARDSRVGTHVQGAVLAVRAPVGVTPSSSAGGLLTGGPLATSQVIATPPGFPSQVNRIPYVVANPTPLLGALNSTLVFENVLTNLGLTVALWGRYRELTQQEA